MERDFMGLNSNEQLSVVKEEILDSAKDSDFVGFAKGSGSQWPFLNKASANPHFISFNGSQDDKPKRAAAAEPFDLGHKRAHGEGQNLVGAGFPKQQFVGGVPFTAALPALPSACSVAEFTNLWSNAKASGSPAQLTIFYGGTVNVFNDISSEKAQAIMFLAENNVSSMASNATHQRSQFMPPTSKLVVNDGVTANQTMNTPPTTALSSPLSVSSHTGAQSGSGSTGNNDLPQGIALGVSAPHDPMVDTPKLINSLGPVSIATMMKSAVPQARKASLARFLEKRKERVMNAAAPYDLSKKYSECASPEMNGTNANASASSGVGCGSL